jgi:hypothetical protein
MFWLSAAAIAVMTLSLVVAVFYREEGDGDWWSIK